MDHLALDGSGSFDPDAAGGDSIVQYEWDLDNDGDFADAGGAVASVDPALFGLGVGVHTISLRVTDSFGATGVDQTTLSIFLNEPVAVFTANPNPAAPLQSITFDASGSFHGRPDRTIVHYEWDFDYDGTFIVDASGPSPITDFAYPTFGSRTAALRVIDDNSPPKSQIATIPIEVSLGNSAPMADAGGPYDIDLGQDVVLDGSGSFDPDAAFGDFIVQYEWDLNNDSLTDATGVSPALAASVLQSLGLGDGTHNVRLTVTDSFGAVGSATTTLEITSNSAPVADAGGPYSADEGAVFQLDGTGSSDAEQPVDTLIFEWDLDYDGDAFQVDAIGITPTVSFPDNFAARTIAVRVTDSQGVSDIATTTLTVNNVAPSVAAAAALVTVNEGKTATNSGTYADPGADTVTLSASEGTIVNHGDGTWSWSLDTTDGPNESQAVTITAEDSDGAMSTTTFALTVNNVAPSMAATAATVTVNEGQTATNSGTYADPGANTVTLSASAGTIVDNGDGTWSWSLDTTDGPDQSQTVTVTATDSDGAMSTTTFALTVNNVAPSVAATAAMVMVNEDQTVTNSGTYADPGTDTVTLSASVGTIVNHGDGTWSWSLDTSDGPDQSQTVTITATDSDGAMNTTTFALTVNNAAPLTGDAAYNVAENSANGTAVGAVSAVDPGNDALAFEITGGTGAAVFAIDPDTGEITVADGSQLDFETASSFTLEVTVTDSDGASDAAEITIHVLNQASISGTVFVDVDQDGLYDANEIGIDGVTIELLSSLGALLASTTTANGGLYAFEDLAPGTYRVREVQPSGVTDGAEHVGSLGGTIVSNDVMQLTLERTDAFDYTFVEIGQSLGSGESAGIGFWQNKHGQELIEQGGTALAAWLTANFANVFGDELAGVNGADVAAFYKDRLFNSKGKKPAGPAKVDAQFMATALAVFFTSRNLAGNVAAAYGFNVTDTGIGTKLVNVGTSGAAFGVANGADLTVMQLLLATSELTDPSDDETGFAYIYDENGDGTIDSAEASLRTMANDIYAAINEQGDP